MPSFRSENCESDETLQDAIADQIRRFNGGRIRRRLRRKHADPTVVRIEHFAFSESSAYLDLYRHLDCARIFARSRFRSDGLADEDIAVHGGGEGGTATATGCRGLVARSR